MKHKIFLLTMLAMLNIASGKAQSLSLIPHPSNFESYDHYDALNSNQQKPILFNGNLYISYKTSSEKYHLAKWDGFVFTIIDNVNSSDKGYLGEPIVFNNELYIMYGNSMGRRQLAKYSGTGTSLTLINNVNSTDGGYTGYPFIFNNELYIQYANAYTNWQLAKYSGTGTSLTLINNPNNTDWGYSGFPIVFNNELYIKYENSYLNAQLAKYNGSGSSLTLINNENNSDIGYNGAPEVFNNHLYFCYRGNAIKLAKYSGTGSSLTYINNPTPTTWGVDNSKPFVFNNELYVKYILDGARSQLAKYNGTATSLTLIDNQNSTDNGYSGEPIVFNNELYFKYIHLSKFHLAKYTGTGTSFTLINNLNTTDYGHAGSPVVFNNELYFQYNTLSYKGHLAKYSGSGLSLNLVNNLGINDFGYNGYPVICNNELFIKYTKFDGMNITNHVAKYQGGGLILYNNPDNGDGYFDAPICFNGELLVRYKLEEVNYNEPPYQLAKIMNSCTSYSSSTQSICPGSAYSFLGNSYTASGVYTDTIVNGNSAGCDSVVSLHLTVFSPSTSTTNLSICPSELPYLWNGLTFNSGGSQTYTTMNSVGCDSASTLNLSIKATSSSTSNLSICPDELPYVWNGLTFNSGGQQTFHTLNSVGCDSAATLDLSIKATSTSSTNLTICSDALPYSWNGLTFNAGGSQTAILTNSVGCDSAATLNLTVLPFSTVATSAVTACISYSWNGNTYTASGAYFDTVGCDITELQLTITHEIVLQAKAFLQGAYDPNTGMMHDSLRTKGLIPTLEPYSASPYLKPGILEFSGELENTPMTTTGPDAIVDWVFLELRDATDPSILISTRRALIQRDGDIVSHEDGVSPVRFYQTPPGTYYVGLKHRNHLGVMSAGTLNFPYCTPVVLDFSNPATPMYVKTSITTNAPRNIMGSVALLWSGDANINKNVKNNGINNDKTTVLNAIGGVSMINNVLNNVYRMEDCNLNGKINYNGTDNDRSVILSTVGVSTPNNVVNQHTID